jgi:hypothetical protein
MMPVFQISALVDALANMGYISTIGNLDLHVLPPKRPYFERWLSNRDGFVRMISGSVNYVGIEDVVRMGPFYNVYCLVENDFITDTDDNAHKLLDAGPYYELYNGKVTNMGWSGGVVANVLARDMTLSEEFASNIMKEEVKKITLKAANYCCVIETRAWEPEGIAAAFKVIDRIAYDVRRLVKTIRLGEDAGA